MLGDAPDSMGRGHRLLIETLFCLRIEAIAAILRRRAAVHFPSGNGPPPCMRHRLTTDECPHWDSNPEHKDFKSSVSANWTMGARLVHTKHRTPLFHESRVTHIHASAPKNPHRLSGGAGWVTKRQSRETPRMRQRAAPKTEVFGAARFTSKA